MAPRNSLSNGKQAEDVKPPMLEHAIQDIYLNTTIESQQAITRLKSLTNELNVFKTDLIKVLGDLKETVKDVVECEGVDGEEEIDEDAPDSDEVAKLDVAFRNVLDKVAEVEIRMNVLSGLRQKLVQGQEMKDINGLYEAAAEKKIESYEAKTSRQKYVEDADYIQFRTDIWEVHHEDEGLPDMKKFIAAEEGDEEDSDDEIEVGTIKEDYKCPLSLTYLKDPMTSTKCKHHFSKAHIFGYLDSLPGAVQPCPVMGCPAQLSKSDLTLNERLAERTDRYVQKLQENGGRKDAGKTFVEVEDSDEEDD